MLQGALRSTWSLVEKTLVGSVILELSPVGTFSCWLPTPDLPGAVGDVPGPRRRLWVLGQDIPGEARVPGCPLQAHQPCPAGLPHLLGFHHPPERHHPHVHVHNVRITEPGRAQGSAPTPCPRPSPGTWVTAPK